MTLAPPPSQSRAVPHKQGEEANPHPNYSLVVIRANNSNAHVSSAPATAAQRDHAAAAGLLAGAMKS